MIETALFAQLSIFLLVVIAFSFSRSASLFHPISFYLLFHFIVFVLRPFMVYYLHFQGRWIYMGFQPTPEQFNFTLFVTTIGMLIFVGVCWFTGSAEPNFDKAVFTEYTPAESRALIWTWLLLGPLALYSAFIASHPINLLGDAGDDEIQMVQDMVSGVTIFVNTTGYIVDAQTMFGPLVIMLMWRFRFALWTWAPLIGFIMYRAFIGNGRWPMITTTLTLILLLLIRRRKKWFEFKYAALIFPIFILFQNVGFDRNLFRDALTGNKSTLVVGLPSQQKTWLEKQDNPDFANFEFLAFLLWAVPDRSHTYTYFTQYLQLFTEPIPRILWPEKPVGAPIKMINLNDYGNFIGLTNSLVGDGWMSGGWLGLIITITIVAFILGICHRRFWERIGNSASVILYCSFLPLTIQWLRDGGISIAKFVLFTFLPILVLRFFTHIFESTEQERLKSINNVKRFSKGREAP